MLLTIFTPTYNRVQTLKRTYDSLVRQNFTDAEWLIVDDGSTDETQEFVDQITSEAPFCVRYCWIEHGGKHRAYNKALTLAQGDLFFVVDSDDWLPDFSLINIMKRAGRLLKDDQPGYIVALKQRPDGSIFGLHLPQDNAFTTLHRLDELKCIGERSFVFRTEVARRYRFPEIDAENFVTESVIYDRIDRDWLALTLDTPITVCEYQPCGLSSDIYRLMWYNPTGFMIYHYQRTDNATTWRERFRHTIRYHAFRKISQKRCEWRTYNGSYRFFVNLFSFVGMAGRLYYKMKCK